MSYFAVITEVPDHKSDDIVRNLALPSKLWQVVGTATQENDYREPVQQVPVSVLLRLRSEVFELGEILILDGGREVAGRGRKPGKWGAKYEEFDCLEVAVARAREVLEW